MVQRTNRRYVTFGILVATFLAAIEGTIVSTAMPTIVGELGGLGLISWVVSMYLLTSAVTTPIYGKMADLYGRKIVFAVGTLLFLLGSMLSGLAQTMEQLIWFRAFQGLGAGGILTMTFTIIGDIYPHEERGKVQGWMSGVWGIAGIFGPLTGGFLVDYVSWRWIFYMNLPFGILSLLLIWLFLQETFEKKKKHVDYPGAITFTVSMTASLYALLTGGTTYAWGSVEILALIAVFFISFSVFLYLQTKSPEPILPLSLFKNRMLTVSYLSGFVLCVVLVGITFYLPLWIQGIYGTGATGSGLTLLPMSIGWPIGAMISGRFSITRGSKTASLIGTCTLIIGSVWLAVVHTESPHWMLYAIMFIVGLGFGFVITALTLTVQSAVDWTQRGTAMGTNTFLRSLGQTIGIAFLGTVFNQSMAGFAEQHPAVDLNLILNPETAGQLPADLLQLMRDALAGSLHTVFVVLAGTSIIALLICFLMQRDKEKNQEAV